MSFLVGSQAQSNRQRFQKPGTWFWAALIILCPVQWFSVTQSEWFHEPPKPIGDGPDYENIAFQIWDGDGIQFDNQDPGWRAAYEKPDHRYAAQLESTPLIHSTTGRPPLFPIIVSGIYSLLGRNSWGFAAVRLFSASCLAISGALAVMMTVQLISSRRNQASAIAERTGIWLGGLGAVGFAATNRTLRDYATDFLTEPLALLLMQCFVILTYLLIAGDPQRRRRLAACAGVSLGALILTRSMFVVWLPALWLLIAWLNPGGRRSKMGVASLIVLFACLTCAPWWIRNCVVLQTWMPLGTQGAITLLGGYSDAALKSDGDWQAAPERQLRSELSQRPEFLTLASDTERELVVSREASIRVRAWFWNHLDQIPILVGKRVFVHWNPYTGRSLIWKVAILLGIASILWHRNRASYLLLGLPLISTVVVAGFYSTGGRFLVPLYGILFTLSGLGIAFVAGALINGLSALRRNKLEN